MNQSRPNSRDRGYSPEWNSLAASVKDRTPWCPLCWAVGVRRASVIVDHIIPLVDAPDRLLDQTNLQVCCRDCHDRVKRVLEAQWRAGKITTADLNLRGDRAHTLRRKLHRPVIGPDGYELG
jgi:hypothetical protein